MATIYLKSNKELLGGFVLIIAEEYPVNLAASLNKLTVKNKNGETYDLSQSNRMDLSYYPGRLEQIYELDDLTIHLALILSAIERRLSKRHLKTLVKSPCHLKQAGQVRSLIKFKRERKP